MDGLYKTEEFCGEKFMIGSAEKPEPIKETEPELTEKPEPTEKTAIVENDALSATDENQTPVEKVEICLNVRSGRALRAFRVLAFAIVCAVGFSAYVYLGASLVKAIRDRGIAEIVANHVFGGMAVRIEPQPQSGGADVPEPEPITQSAGSISAEDLSVSSVTEFSNETAYDVAQLDLPAVTPFPADGEVLIIHTHGTEAYASDNTVLPGENFRSNDPARTVVAVGKTIADVLSSHGVRVHHCMDMFDRESYIDAYSRSASAVAEYLADNPKIALVLDVHRDAIIREDQTVVKTGLADTAQLMLVCGTNEQGADFPTWRANLAFAVEYQSRLIAAAPALVRHINLRGASFNEQLCERYLLLEVGSCGNTLDEANAAAATAAETLAGMILAGA